MTALGWLAVVVCIAVVLALASERIAGHRAALGGFGLLLLAGALTPKQALATIGSTGMVTVLCMFAVAMALEHSGAVDQAVRRLLRVAGTRPRTAWMMFFAAILGGSAVVPNTPVVVLACPIALLLAQRTRTAAGRVLMPVAFLATLGGSLSLVGSSINVVASGVMVDHGEAGFGLWSLTPIAAPVALVGVLWLALIGRHGLPKGPPVSSRLFEPDREFLVEHRVGVADPFLGQTLAESLRTNQSASLVDVHAQNPSANAAAAPSLASYVPIPGDRLLLRVPAARLAEEALLRQRGEEVLVIEAWVPPASRLSGLRVDRLRLEEIHGLQLLGVAPLLAGVIDVNGHRITTGDRLLLAGRRGDLERFLATESALSPLQVERSQQARGKAPFALAALALLVLAAASGWRSLEVATLAAAALLVAAGALPSRQTVSPVLTRTLGILLGMLGIGAALEATGATAAMVVPLIDAAAALGPWPLLVVVYLCASLLSELVTNNAVIVLLLPIVLGIAHSLGLAPMPYALAVVFGASASFATPIGYQTNTWVYQLGGYRFGDFLRVGGPLKLVVGVTALLMIGWLYPPIT